MRQLSSFLLNDKKIALRFALIIMKKSFVVFGGSFLFLFSREQKYLRSQIEILFSFFVPFLLL